MKELEALSHYQGNLSVREDLGGGSVSKLWKVGNSSPLVLKRYPPWIREDDVEFIQRFTSYLIESRFATPGVIKTTDGKPWIKVEGDYFSLYQLLEGQKFDIHNKVDIRLAGVQLGNLHYLSRQYQAPYVRDWWRISNYPFDEYLAQAGSLGIPPIIESQMELIKTAQAKIIELLRGGGAIPWISYIVIHGDFRPDNLLVAQNGLITLDLDNARQEFKEMDFSRSLRFICGLPEKDDWKDRARQFIEGYFEGSRSTYLSREIILAAILAQPLKEVIWQMRAYLKSKEVIHEAIFHLETEFLKSVIASHRDILSFLGSII